MDRISIWLTGLSYKSRLANIWSGFKRKNRNNLYLRVGGAIISIAALTILLLLANTGRAAAVNGSSSPTSFEVDLEFPGLEITDNGDGTESLSMQGYTSQGGEGLPSLPSRIVALAVPPGMQAERVTLLDCTWEAYPGFHMIEWGQPLFSMDGDNSEDLPEPVPADAGVYDSDQTYPETAISLAGTGKMRKYSIADVRVTPVRYRPSSGRIEACRSIRFVVECMPGEEIGALELEDESPVYEMASEIIENYEQAMPWYQADNHKGPEGPADSGDAADYVIITSSCCESRLSRFVSFKEQQGMSVLVVTSDWIDSNYSGVDLQEKIRNFLQANYLSLGIDYVLLVGQMSEIPMRYCHTPMETTVAEDKYTPTDYYYSDLSGDKDWDINGDGKYGEWGVDTGPGGVDFYPEVFVGRIDGSYWDICESDKVEEVCDKTIDYETDIRGFVTTWKRDALLLGANFGFHHENHTGFPATWGSYVCEAIRNDVLTPNGHPLTTMYEKAGLEQDPHACHLPLNHINVISQWQQRQYGIVILVGHGNHNCVTRRYWLQDSDNDGIPDSKEIFEELLVHVNHIDLGELDELHPCIVYANSCENARYEEPANLIRELMLTGPAAAAIGSTRPAYHPYGWNDKDDGGALSLNYYFWWYLLQGDEGIGAALRMSGYHYYSHFYPTTYPHEEFANLYGFNLYGDPSMRLDPEDFLYIGDVDPISAENGGLAKIAIEGANLLGHSGTHTKMMLQKSNQPDLTINASNVIVHSPDRITCSIDLYEAPVGKWDVVVENSDGKKNVLKEGFSVQHAAPAVTSITPDKGKNDDPDFGVEVAGNFFRGGATVKLREVEGYQLGIEAKKVYVVSPEKLVCEFDLLGKQGGKYDLIVTNSDGKFGVLEGGFTIEALPLITSITPEDGQVGSEVTIEGKNFGVTQGSSSVAFRIKGHTWRIASSYTSWSDTQIKCIVPHLSEGSYQVRVLTPCGSSNYMDFTVNWLHKYFAEGYTGEGFEEWLCLMNPSNNWNISAIVTYMSDKGIESEQSLIVDAESRFTIDVNAAVGPGKNVSIKVASEAPIVAERAMYFDYKGSWDGGHCVVGTPDLSTFYYFAEGYTGEGFEEWLCLMNPSLFDTVGSITYMFENGETAEEEIVLEKTSRKTIDVNGAVGPGKNVSIKVTSEAPIVAERAMYFDYKGSWDGGHCVVGTPDPSTFYYFAEGYTGEGFEEWLCLMNPNSNDISADITYMFENGETAEEEIVLEKTSRKTIDVNAAVGPGKNVSIKVASEAPIVAERAMYFDYKRSWDGGHCVVGTPSPETDFCFAEGYTGEGFEEWLCLMNPSSSDTVAKITYMFENGETIEEEVLLGMNSRMTVDVNAAVGPGKNVSIKVASEAPIVAERAMYFDYKGSWDGGHCVAGHSH